MIDFNIDEGLAIKNKDVDLLLQQIDILFDTNKREVFGDIRFGTEYDKFLYKLKLTPEEITQEVLSDLYSLNLLGFTPQVQVYLLQGTEQDIALIDIELTRDNERYNRTYKIS